MFDTRRACLICAVVETRHSHSCAGATLSLRDREKISDKLGKVPIYSLVPSILALKMAGGRIFFFFELSLCHIRSVFTERTALLNPMRELKESRALLSVFF